MKPHRCRWAPYSRRVGCYLSKRAAPPTRPCRPRALRGRPQSARSVTTVAPVDGTDAALEVPCPARRAPSDAFRSQADASHCPLDLHVGVVDELEGVRVAQLNVDVAALLGNHLEERNPSQLIGLAHHLEVSLGHIPH